MFIEILTQQLPASSLAVATTIHLAMFLLRLHRSADGTRNSALLLPSVVFSATPWFLPGWGGLAFGFVLHWLWFVACENLIRVPVPAASSRPQAERPKAATNASPTPASPRPAASSGVVQVPVFAVFKESQDITTFRMARPDGFDFEAGQFVTVRVNIDGRPITRCYSISSGPEAKGYLEISVKKQGLMSGTLHATIRPGSMLSIRKPGGAFVFPKGDDRPVTLLAGGIGITPLMSMLRHCVNTEPTRPITLLYSVNGQRDVVFGEELRWLAKRHPQIKVVVTTTEGPHSSDYHSGRIDRQMLIDHVQNLGNNVFLLCGPPPMIESMQSILADLDVPKSQVRFEAFEAAVAAAQREVEAVEVGAIDQSTAIGQAAAGRAYDLRLTASARTLAADAGQSLLETCEESGVEIPSICRAGVCGTCRTRVVDGSVRCDEDILNEADRSQGYVLACVAWPESDCAIEA